MQTPPAPGQKRVAFDQMDSFLEPFVSRLPTDMTPIITPQVLGVVSSEGVVDAAKSALKGAAKVVKSIIGEPRKPGVKLPTRMQWLSKPPVKAEAEGEMVVRAPTYVSAHGASHAPARAHHKEKSKGATKAAHAATSKTIGSSNALKHHEAKTAHELAAHHAKQAGHHDLAGHHGTMAMHHGDIYRAMGNLHDRHAQFHQHNPQAKGEETAVTEVPTQTESQLEAQRENQQCNGKARYQKLAGMGRKKATEAQNQEDCDAFTDCIVLEANSIDYSEVSVEQWQELEELAKLGSGARFKALRNKLAHKARIRNPGAVAASIGRAKLGKARFQKLAAAGK